eukprot:3678031-Rhodomonas_salina.5
MVPVTPVAADHHRLSSLYMLPRRASLEADWLDDGVVYRGDIRQEYAPERPLPLVRLVPPYPSSVPTQALGRYQTARSTRSALDRP